MSYTEDFIAAMVCIDWGQVHCNTANGGSPCFHLHGDGRICGRSSNWAGHHMPKAAHLHTPLYVAVSQIAKDAARKAEGGAA